MDQHHNGPFGSCCANLFTAMKEPPHAFFYVGKNDVFYLTVGYTRTEQGLGWFDHAVIYCPFCGKALQSREDIARKSQASN
ncbi:MAG: hypothetical protein ACJ8J7_13785 [Sulfurifustaceae bacterium]